MVVPIRSIADLRNVRVNTSLLAEIYTSKGATGCHAFSRETLDVGASRAHARFFAPADNIPEDPATGSACGALGAYLVHHGGLSVEPKDGRYEFVIEQGDFIHRPSRIKLKKLTWVDHQWLSQKERCFSSEPMSDMLQLVVACLTRTHVVIDNDKFQRLLQNRKGLRS
jgi:PhzF family phenazine biosynthesis protein